MLMSQSKFAKEIGRSRQYVNKLTQAGVIPTYDKKRVKPDEARARIKEHEDPSRDAQRAANKENRQEDLFSEQNLPVASMADMSDQEKSESTQEHLAALKEAKDLLDQSEGLDLDIDGTDLKDMKLTDIRKLSEYINYQLKTHELSQKTGEVVAVEDVKKQAFDMARGVRDAILAIPPRIAPILASESNQHTIQTLMIKEITSALEALCDV